MLWTVSGAFFIPQTALLGFLLTRDVEAAWDATVLAGSAIGLVLGTLSYATLRRTSLMYAMRVAQAREVEPREWGFLRRGQNVAEGRSEVVDGTRFEMPRYAQMLRTRNASRILAGIFLIAYASLVVLSGPWWS